MRRCFFLGGSVAEGAALSNGRKTLLRSRRTSSTSRFEALKELADNHVISSAATLADSSASHTASEFSLRPVIAVGAVANLGPRLGAVSF